MKHLITRGLILAALLFATASCKAEDKTQAQPTPPDPTPSGPESGELYVKVQGEDCYISAKLSAEKDIVYWFKKCLFNELYTFYRVGVVTNPAAAPTQKPEAAPELTLNLAFSDNIGPFAVENGGWCGANHSYKEGLARYADEVRIDVQNVIYNPVRPSTVGGETLLEEPLCRETVVYTIRRNSIEVAVSHRFENDVPVTVVAYYGMQSMFNEETHTLTSGGAFPDWSVLDNPRLERARQCALHETGASRFPAFRREERQGLPVGLPARRGAGRPQLDPRLERHIHRQLLRQELPLAHRRKGCQRGCEDQLEGRLHVVHGAAGRRCGAALLRRGRRRAHGAVHRRQECLRAHDDPPRGVLGGFELLDANGGVEVSDSGAQQLRIRAPKAGGCVIQLKGLSEIPITD